VLNKFFQVNFCSQEFFFLAFFFQRLAQKTNAKLTSQTRMSIKQQLDALLKERILIIDGAMGTMIQRYKLKEEDFRGDRFPNPAKDLKGNNDLLVLTRPHVIREIHEVSCVRRIFASQQRNHNHLLTNL